MLETLGKFFGAVGAFAAAIYAARKFYFWLRPLKVEAWGQMTLDGSKPDAMGAKITNRSSETLYLRTCVVRGTYRRRVLALYHLRNPFIRPRLYPNVWYNGAVYNLMDESPIKLEPQQLIELRWDIYEHPLNAMHTTHFVAIATLTSGRTVHSKRVPAPAAWRLIGRRSRGDLPNNSFKPKPLRGSA